MTSSYLMRLSGLAAIAGGALLIIAAIAGQFPESGGVAYYIFFRLTFFAAHVFIFFALMGIYLRQHEQAGWLGLTGFVLAIIANALFTTTLGLRAFLNLTNAFFLIGPRLLPLSLLLLAIATTRTRILPAWAAWLIFLGPLLNLAVAVFGQNRQAFDAIVNIIGAGIAPALLAAGLIWMGIELRSKPRRNIVADRRKE